MKIRPWIPASAGLASQAMRKKYGTTHQILEPTVFGSTSSCLLPHGRDRHPLFSCTAYQSRSPTKGDFRVTWLGNVRYPPETMQDLSDAEWIGLLKERYGDRICFYEPQAGGNPCRTAAEWRDRGMLGVYLKG